MDSIICKKQNIYSFLYKRYIHNNLKRIFKFLTGYAGQIDLYHICSSPYL